MVPNFTGNSMLKNMVKRIYDQESCTEFALTFSEQQNIVESEEWLNLKDEDGLMGGATHYGTPSLETRIKISNSLSGKSRGPLSSETKEKLSIANRGKKIHTDEFKQKLSDLKSGVKLTDIHKANIAKSVTGKTYPPRSEESRKRTADAIRAWHQSRKESLKAIKF